MNRYFIWCAAVGLAACEPMPVDISERVLPAEVQSYLIEGQPASTVVQDGLGCYLVVNQITDPPQGYFLRDRRTGEPLCYDAEGQRIPYVAPSASEA